MITTGQLRRIAARSGARQMRNVEIDIILTLLEEVLAEKIRAASQRSKIRDLYDLSESLNLEFDRPRMRGLAVLKLWCQRDALSYERLKKAH